MRILVDADSCPRQVRAIIIRAARRISQEALFFADRILPDCKGEFLTMKVVNPGTDSADNAMVTEARDSDLCITRDIILAARLIEKGSHVIDDRGALFTPDNMRERLSIRNAMTDFREAGIFPDRTKPLSPKDIQKFANCLDRELTAMLSDSY